MRIQHKRVIVARRIVKYWITSLLLLKCHTKPSCKPATSTKNPLRLIKNLYGELANVYINKHLLKHTRKILAYGNFILHL